MKLENKSKWLLNCKFKYFLYSFFKLIDFFLNESEMERLNFGMYVY